MTPAQTSPQRDAPGVIAFHRSDDGPWIARDDHGNSATGTTQAEAEAELRRLLTYRPANTDCHPGREGVAA